MTKNRKKIGIWLLMLAVMMMFFSMGTSVKAEDEPEQIETQREKLPTPQNVSISDDWTLSFDDVPEANGYYRIEIMRDDEICCSSYQTSSLHYIKDGVFKDSIAQYVLESGRYYVIVEALDDYDPDKYEDSDPSEPVVKNYIKPDTQLGSTVAVWDAENPGQLFITPVENAGGYEFGLFEVLPDGSLKGKAGLLYQNYPAAEEFSIDFLYRIEQFGAGQYVVKTRALSGNIDEIANGEWGEASAVYDTEKQAAATDKIISDAVSGETSASDALDTVVNQISKDKLGADMQTNDKVLEQMKALEEKYAREKGITVKSTVSEEAAKYVSPEKVSMTGAGLNAEAGNVSLDISVPDEKVEVLGEVYAKSVQFDIKLKNEDAEIHDLKVPVTITMPVPEGLQTKHLILLHYHGTGEPERVVFKDNNDGTVTFTVKDFSVFVFAENADKQPEEPKDEPETPKDEQEKDWEEPEEDEAESEGVTGFRSPNTSDAGNAGLYFGLSAASLLVLFVTADRRKRI